MQTELPANLCLNCFCEIATAPPCLNCGWKPGAPATSPLYLTPGTVLREQYVIGLVLGHGGFGITYLGWDLNLARKIAIKEYFPGGVGMRMSGSPDVFAYSPTLRTDYDWGLDRYLEEARVVARFENHPNIVWVLNFFAANGTAYIILEYLDGSTFESYLQRAGGKVDWAIAMRIVSPVIDALREVHRAGLLHRDVSPDNIYLLRNGQVKVIDFGAARYSLGQHSKNLSVILKPGFAPPEQYQTRGNQGPWTDVYATACTLYRAIAGEVPPPAPDRLARVPLVPPSQRGVTIAPAAEQALLRALALEPEDRFADMDEFRRALQGESVPVLGPVAPVPVPVPPPAPIPVPDPPHPVPWPVPSFFEMLMRRIGLPKWLLAAGAFVAVLVAMVALIPKAKEPEVTPTVRKDDAATGEKSGKEANPDTVPSTDTGTGGSTVPPDNGPPDSGPAVVTPPMRSVARITGFEFFPDKIERGQTTELRWSVEGATRVRLDGRAVNASGRMSLSPARNLSASLTAEAPGGGAERTAMVSVFEKPPVDPPIVPPIDTSLPADRVPRPLPVGRGWEVYHHHGYLIPGFAIDWSQLRNPRIGTRAGEPEVCLGTLSIEGTRLKFDSRTSNDGFDVELQNLDKVEVNRNRIGGNASFQVKVRKGRNYNFVSRQSVDNVVTTIRSAMPR